MMKRGHDLVVIYSANDSKSFRIEFWEQPLRRWLIGRLYHWYDMRVFKLPGFKQLENLLELLHRGHPLSYLPLSAKQDLRCYDLTVKKRKILAMVNIDRETYVALGGKHADG